MGAGRCCFRAVEELVDLEGLEIPPRESKERHLQGIELDVSTRGLRESKELDGRLVVSATVRAKLEYIVLQTKQIF